MSTVERLTQVQTWNLNNVERLACLCQQPEDNPSKSIDNSKKYLRFRVIRVLIWFKM